LNSIAYNSSERGTSPPVSPRDEKAMRSSSFLKRLNMKYRRHRMRAHVLLLGASDTGKSTIMKQMRILHDDGHTGDDKLMYKKMILNTIVGCMKELIELACVDNPEIQFTEQVQITRSCNIANLEQLSAEESKAMSFLCRQTLIKDTLQLQKHKFPQNLVYFMAAIDRISKTDYIPSEQDILMVGRKNIRCLRYGIENGKIVIKGY